VTFQPPHPPATLNTVGLIVKPHLVGVEPMITELSDWLVARGCRVIGEEAARHLLPALSKGDLAEQADLVVVIGGDGTMISAARIIGKRMIPVLGINFGFLGYLTEYTSETIYNALESVLDGGYRLDIRLKLEVAVIRDGNEALRTDVINDFVITKTMLARLLPIQCWINGQFVSTFHADGLIVATPTGSTAYSLSAGGPIIHPAMRSFVITPICPHTLTNRPLVVPDDCEIELRLTNVRGNVDDVFLTLDGQTGFVVTPDDRVILRKSDAVLALVEPPNKDYFKLLRDKLKWGAE
jgi:NAD+ kinase